MTRFRSGWVAAVSVVAVSMAVQADRLLFVAPSARGDGSGRDAANARAFSAEELNQRFLGDASEPRVEVRFAPGSYALTSMLLVPGNARPSERTVRLVGDGGHPSEVVLLNEKAFVPGVQDRMLRFDGLRRVEIENLTFDGNWDAKMRRAVDPFLAPAYKNQPVSVTSRTGRIRRVIVRNHGAVGYVPQTRFDNPAGVEAFPLAVGTDDVGQGPEGGDPRPWVVEDCEVHGFHPEFRGYVTMLMAGAGNVQGKTPAWAAGEAGRQLMLLRRNLVRGTSTGAGVIALGSAGCIPGVIDGGRVLYTDNVVLNASMGFNTDCGRLTDVGFVRSMFLDVWIGGNASAGFAGMMSRYDFSGNALRFGHRREYPDYTRFRFSAARPVSDGTLALGRAQTNELVGFLVGTLSDSRFAGNRFTMRAPAAAGPESGPVEVRLAHKLTPKDMPWGSGFQDATEFEASGNVVSGVAWDFASVEPVKAGRLNRFATGQAPELERGRDVGRLPEGFRPMGRVERVLPLWGRRSTTYGLRVESAGGLVRREVSEPREPALSGVLEVSLGEPGAVSGGALSVPVRLALQPMPGEGETRGLSGSNLWLEVDGVVSNRLMAVTGAGGLAVFRVPVPAEGPVFLRLRAGHTPTVTGDAARVAEEYRSAWSEAEVPVGTVVTMRAAPDVADEKTGQAGVLRFVRTPAADGALGELEVYFRVGGGSREARPGDDFRLEMANGAEVMRGGLGRIRFRAGEREVWVRVVPLEDDLYEREWATFRLIAPGGRRAYAIGSGSEANVYFHDGPEWTRRGLPAPAGHVARPLAISGPYGSSTNVAVLVGGVLVGPGGIERPAWWRWRMGSEAPEFLPELPAAWQGVRPLRLGSMQADGWPRLRGELGPANARKRFLSGDVPAGLGEAAEPSPDATWWVGSRGRPGAEELLMARAGEGPVAVAAGGLSGARWVAVNDRGVAVGEARQNGKRRGFRLVGPGSLGAGALLPLLSGAEESGVVAVAPDGTAAGWCLSATGRRACFWPGPGVRGAGTVVELGRPGGRPESTVVGLAANGDVLAMAGRGERWEVSYVFVSGLGLILPLDDEAAVHADGGAAGVLEAVGMNPQGWVIGSHAGGGWVARRLLRP